MVRDPGYPSREELLDIYQIAAERSKSQHAELLDLYKVAVEEYRFQVKLNTDRSRDYLVLNSAIIAAGITLIGQAHLPLMGGVVFSIGVVVAVLAMLGTHTQHGYYRDTRNKKTELAVMLGIANLVLIKTKSGGSRYRRFGSVTWFNYSILSLLCLVDLTGALSGFGIIPRPSQKASSPPPSLTKSLPRVTPPVPQPLRPSGAVAVTPKRPSSGPPVHPKTATHRPP